MRKHKHTTAWKHVGFARPMTVGTYSVSRPTKRREVWRTVGKALGLALFTVLWYATLILAMLL